MGGFTRELSTSCVYFYNVQNPSPVSPTIERLHALVSGIGPGAPEADSPSTRASLSSQISAAALYNVERLYTERYGMTRGIPFVQYLRTFVRLSYDVGEDAAVTAFTRDLERARAEAEPREWAF